MLRRQRSSQGCPQGPSLPQRAPQALPEQGAAKSGLLLLPPRARASRQAGQLLPGPGRQAGCLKASVHLLRPKFTFPSPRCSSELSHSSEELPQAAVAAQMPGSSAPSRRRQVAACQPRSLVPEPQPPAQLPLLLGCLQQSSRQLHAVSQLEQSKLSTSQKGLSPPRIRLSLQQTARYRHAPLWKALGCLFASRADHALFIFFCCFSPRQSNASKSQRLRVQQKEFREVICQRKASPAFDQGGRRDGTKAHRQQVQHQRRKQSGDGSRGHEGPSL